jgi:outer membrane protein assembly factor BamB
VIWKRDDLPCRHFRGPGSSPVLFKNLLILTMDGINTQYVTALDKRTGRTIWKTDRTTEWNDLGANGKPAGDGDFRKAFSTPLIFEAGGVTQMISAGSKAAYSYDPSDGHELWRIKLAGHTTAVRPVFGRGLVFLASGQGKTEMLAVRPDGHGDVTGTHVAWQSGRGAPKMPSPLLVDDLLYLLGDSGVVRCVEAATGNEVWQERIGGEYYASPLCADGNIYCFSREGKTTVLKAGRSLEVRATNALDDGFMASPAVSGKAFFLRTKTNLYRIEADSPIGAAKKE